MKRLNFITKVLVVLALIAAPVLTAVSTHSEVVSNRTLITLAPEVAEAVGSADFTYVNPNAQIAFLQALAALPGASGGTLQVLSTGTVDFAAAITSTKANVTVIGASLGTAFTFNGVNPPFIVVHNGWTFVNCTFDVAPNMGATTNWSWSNVSVGAIHYDYRNSAYSVIGGAVIATSVAGGAVSGTSVTDSGLTSGRVTYAGAGGLLTNEAGFEYNAGTNVLSSPTVTATTLNAPTGRTATYVVAASNAPAHVKAQADYVCLGSNDGDTIQAVFNLFPSVVVISEGTYDIDNGHEITITPTALTHSTTVYMYGAKFTYTGGTGHIFTVASNLLNDNVWEQRRVYLYGGQFYGNATAISGVRLIDQSGAVLRDMYFQDWTNTGDTDCGGILLRDNNVGGFCESNNIENIVMRNVSRGITLRGLNVGYSFGNNTFQNIHIEATGGVGSVGFNMPHNGHLYRCLLNRVGIWIIDNNSTGFTLVDDCTSTVIMNPSVEIQGAATGVTAFWVAGMTRTTGVTIINPMFSAGGGAFLANVINGNTGGSNQVHSIGTGYIAQGEIRTASGSLTAGNANAIGFAWHDPELQDIYIKKVVVTVTTGGGTAGSHGDCGIADDAAGTNRGTEFFNDLLLNNVSVNDSWVVGDGGTQTKWVFCQDSVSATDGWVVMQILDANAAALVGSFYIEYTGK